MFSIPSTLKKRISGIRRTQDGIRYLWHILCWSPASQEANSRGWRVENARHTKKLHQLYIRESPQHDQPNNQPDQSSDDLMVRQWRGTMKIGRKEAKTSQMPWRGSDCYEREETMMSLANNLLGLFVLHWLAGWALNLRYPIHLPLYSDPCPTSIHLLTAVATDRPHDQRRTKVTINKCIFERSHTM